MTESSNQSTIVDDSTIDAPAAKPLTKKERRALMVQQALDAKRAAAEAPASTVEPSPAIDAVLDMVTAAVTELIETIPETAAAAPSEPSPVVAKKTSKLVWTDLPAGHVKGSVKPGCVLDNCLQLLAQGPATLDELQALLDLRQQKEGGDLKQRHSVTKLLRWANRERGFGFTMIDGRIVVS